MKRIQELLGYEAFMVRAVDEPAFVKVNGEDAIVLSQPGGDFLFRKQIAVNEGNNTITIEATDASGNSASNAYSVVVGGVEKQLEYDLNGNLRFQRSPDGTVLQAYQWDAKNRLVKLIDGTQETDFEYDGLDRRVLKIERTHGSEISRTHYIWEGSSIVQSRAADASTIQRNYFQQGFQENAQNYYYTKDHLGSIREVVASDGFTIETAYDYSPWGEVTKIAGTGVESDFLYTGHFYHGESDLHLTLYRAYNPELGMWLARDSFENITGSPGELLEDGSNLYAYVGNNPISLIDPNGLWGIDPQSEKHTHRNRNNRCPSKEPEYKKGPRGYRDCEGGKWSKDPQWSADKYHGGHNTYRGSGRNKGSQCVYDNAGRLIDSGPYLGTYDYSAPGTPNHVVNDVMPHNENPNYEPGLTEQFGCE